MKYIFALLILIGLVTAGGAWLGHTVIQAERAKVMERAIELTRDTDKRLKVIRKATDADLCRALGGTEVEGECT